jgi:thiol-disulfide isomerase/thioredoxin
LLVNFWASWCNSCIREFPSLERLSRGMDTRRFALLAVNVREGKGTVQRYGRLQDAGIQMLMDKDGTVADSWGVNVYPTSFIVDANGNILGNVIGETDWDSEDKHVYIKSLFPDSTDE